MPPIHKMIAIQTQKRGLDSPSVLRKVQPWK